MPAALQDGTAGKHDMKLESHCFMILHNFLDLTIVQEPVKEHVCLRLFVSDIQERIETIKIGALLMVAECAVAVP
jgi:hypothetical protein